MALFSKKSEWEETFRINTVTRGGKAFCSFVFWIWGLLGLLAIGIEFISIPSGVGVGTSSYIAAQCVYYRRMDTAYLFLSNFETADHCNDGIRRDTSFSLAEYRS